MTTDRERKPNVETGSEQQADTILLRDLAPRQSVKGGTGKLRFGERTTDVSGTDGESPKQG